VANKNEFITIKKTPPKRKTPTSQSLDSASMTTVERLMQSMTPKQRQKYEEEYKEFALSEMLLAIMEQDKTSVRQLAKIAGVSPTIIQAMRSGTQKDYSLTVFLKVLKGLGCKRFKVEYHGKYLDIPIQIELKPISSKTKSSKK